MIELAVEIFGTAPTRCCVAGPNAWIALPADASAESIDDLAARAGGSELNVFESSCSVDTLAVTTYVAPGRVDEFDVTESAATPEEGIDSTDEATKAHHLAWHLATENWEIALARYLVSSGMIELRAMRLPVATVASALPRNPPTNDREWEQLGRRVRERLASSQDVEVFEDIDHTSFESAARKTLPAAVQSPS